ncbi:MAG: aminoacyl-tRNA hydrolase [Lachnospiraceae bacterium]|nr:aminoacyl-tRNA hydrolase [Lachnospiraceae bacterium]
MYIIVGLGNPGKEYAHSRHNTGFEAMDILADKYNISVSEKKHKALIGKGMIEGNKVVLVKPQTYMNLSGESVREVLDFYKADETQDLIVIYDDVSLPPGQIRIRKKGSAGGHNGIKNIISHLGHDTFPRIKIGVGEKPAQYDMVDWVLGHFNKEDSLAVTEACEKAAMAVAVILNEGPDSAQNKFN